MDSCTQKVLSALAAVKHVPAEGISVDSSLDDLQLDSLDKVTLLFELEKQFDISIPDEQLRSIRSVRDVVDGVARLSGQTLSAEPAAQP